MNEQPLALLPELLLAAGATLGLLLGLFLPRGRQWLVQVLAAGACVAALVAAIAAAGTTEVVYGGSYAIDVGLATGRIVVLLATLLVLGISAATVRAHARETEYYVLVLLAALGTIVLAGASDLMLLFAAYLLASVPLYALAGFAKDASGTEASLKYYLLGAYLGVLMLVGVTVLYGVGRATAYGELAPNLAAAPGGAVAVGVVALLAGLLFKIGGVPGHFWVPDVTEGSSVPVAAFVTTVPKVGGLIALYRLAAEVLPAAAFDWRALLAVLAAASMTLGNLAAFFQESVRRLLAYSTISQVGYVLLAAVVADRAELATRSLLFYTGAYALTNLGAFAVVAALPQARTLADYAGLARARPLLAVALVVCLLGLVGTPPTAVFFGKLGVFAAAVDGGYAWLAVLAVVNTVASLFYYLRWIARAVGEGPGRHEGGGWAAATAYGIAGATLLLGVGSGLALDLLSSGTLIR